MKTKIDNKQLEKIMPIGFTIVFLSVNFLSIILVIRALLVFPELAILKKLFLGSAKLLFLPGNVVYFFMAIVLAKKWKKGRYFKILMILVIITGLCILSLSLYLNYLDAANYSNFVYSQYNIYLPSLRFYANFQILFLFAAFLSFLYHKSSGSKYVKIIGRGFFKGAVIILLAIILYNNFLELPNFVYRELDLYKEYISIPQSERNESPDLGDYYFRIEFVRANTVENSVVIHPTQSVAFPDIGNQPLIRYTLYPRKLVTQKLENKYFSENINDNVPTYYILSKGVDNDSVIYFPEHSLKTESITVLFKDGQIKNYSDVDYSLEFVKSLGDFEIGVLRSK